MMTQEQMNALVPAKLEQIEREHGVKVLYAAESGSRCWGFASPDSDFDVRFIYIRPKNDYLLLNEPRDVIETPIDDTWDVSGWDLRKALKLLHKSNPSLFEWMVSQIRYVDTGFAGRLAPLMREYFIPKSMMYHYYHMACNNAKIFLQGETVIPKKYFYVLRPVLACLWIRENNSAPPILYSQLVDALLPEAMKPINEALLDMKKSLPEKAEVPRVKEVHKFLDEKLDEIGTCLHGMPDYRPKDRKMLNDFFLSELAGWDDAE